MFYSIFYYALGYFAIAMSMMVGFGSNLDTIFGTRTILTVLGTTLGGGFIALGPRLGPACRSVFSRDPSPPQIRLGILLFRAARYGALAGGFFSLVIGLILIMQNIEDPSGLGPSMALAQEGLFWGIFIGYFVLLPQQTRLEYYLLKSGDTSTEFSETPLDLLLVSSGFLVGGLFLTLTNYMF